MSKKNIPLEDILANTMQDVLRKQLVQAMQQDSFVDNISEELNTRLCDKLISVLESQDEDIDKACKAVVLRIITGVGQPQKEKTGKKQ